MAALAKRLADLGRGLAGSIRRFPLEAALGLVYFVLFVLADNSVLPVRAIFILALAIPHYMLLFSVHRLAGRSAFTVIAWLLWVPLLFLRNNPPEAIVAACWVVSVLVLLLGTRPMDDGEFGKNVLQHLSRIAFGVLLGLALSAVIMAIVASLKFLFDFDWGERVMVYPLAFIWTSVIPLMCCFLVSEEPQEGGRGRFVDILVNFILSPALVLYTLILYAYIIWIAVRWELPDGGVAVMVLCFLLLGLLCCMLRMQAGGGHFGWFYKAFPFVSVPPLVLLWVGIARRVGEYGITEVRFYLVALAALTTLFVLLLPLKVRRRFQLMTLTLAAVAAVTTFIPGISARDIGLRAQKQRFRTMIERGTEEARGAWDYLRAQLPAGEFEAEFGEYKSRFWPAAAAEPADAQRHTWQLDEELELPQGAVLVPPSLYYMVEDSRDVTFYADKRYTRELLRCPVRARADQAVGEGGDGSAGGGADGGAAGGRDVLIYSNDSYMAVFERVTLTVRDDVSFFKPGRVTLLRKK